ncbi:MAG: 1-(5-phosphoribosyl)-5-[(5-phosphoribosylamino)methylideneamino]imidazole-4-carboxamide isomerase [Cytophagaceae bacterium]
MIQVIPAIDIIDGKCVRLTQGDYQQKKEYHSNPLEIAKQFEGVGIQRLHLVDLDGARLKKITNQKVLETIANNTSLVIDFGGGLQSDEDLKVAFDSGATQITAGSIAVKNPAMVKSWMQKFGAGKIIVGTDSKDGKIAVSGWQETTSIEIDTLVEEYLPYGFSYSICTDVAKDGLLQGPSFDLYQRLHSKYSQVNWIASGGVAGMDDIVRLNEMGVYGVIVGKAFYEGKITLEQLASFNN